MRPYRSTAASRFGLPVSSAIWMWTFSSCGDQSVQAAGGQHPVAGGHVQIALARVLREVTQRAGAGDLTAVGSALAGQHPESGGLTGTVAADQADPVAVLQADWWCRRAGSESRPAVRGRLR